MLRFQIASFGRSAVEALHIHGDALLIAAVAGAAPVGWYRAARYIVDATRLPFLALAQGVQVEYSRQWFGADGAGLRKLARRATALAIVAAASGYGLLLIFRQPVIELFLGPEFARAEGSLLIMTVGALAYAGVAAVYVLPAAAGRAGPHLGALAVAVAAQAGVILLLAPGRGAEGAGVGRGGSLSGICGGDSSLCGGRAAPSPPAGAGGIRKRRNGNAGSGRFAAIQLAKVSGGQGAAVAAVLCPAGGNRVQFLLKTWSKSLKCAFCGDSGGLSGAETCRRRAQGAVEHSDRPPGRSGWRRCFWCA